MADTNNAKLLTVGELKRQLDTLPQGALIQCYEVELPESQYESANMRFSLTLSEDGKRLALLFQPDSKS